MEIGGIVRLATDLAQVRTQQEVGIAVLKKALDIERAKAALLLDALPAAPANNLPSHLGQNIDLVA